MKFKVVLICVASIFCFIYFSPNDQNNDQKQDLSIQEDQEPVLVNSKSVEEAPTITLQEEIVKEYQEDPHASPPSLIKFAEQMAMQIQEAKKSPEKVNAVFSQLENCVDESKGSVTSLRAYCLWNAERLMQAYPDFYERYHSLQRRASDDVLILARAIGGEKNL
jgi:hypothetical protein